MTDDELQARLEADAIEAASSDGGSTIHIAKSLNGPWTPLQTTLGACNNPAPWVHPNGTIYVLYVIVSVITHVCQYVVPSYRDC